MMPNASAAADRNTNRLTIVEPSPDICTSCSISVSTGQIRKLHILYMTMLPKNIHVPASVRPILVRP